MKLIKMTIKKNNPRSTVNTIEDFFTLNGKEIVINNNQVIRSNASRLCLIYLMNAVEVKLVLSNAKMPEFFNFKDVEITRSETIKTITFFAFFIVFF
jgi:hypothetical protein